MQAIAPLEHLRLLTQNPSKIKRWKKNGQIMSNRDGFASGFFLGATLGGFVGGVLGVVLASRLANEENTEALPEVRGKRNKPAKLTGENMETARLSLEDKIAQLNQAIDDVRQQLGSVNGNGGSDDYERSLPD